MGMPISLIFISALTPPHANGLRALHYVQPLQSGSLDRPSKRPLELDGLASPTISSGWILRNLPRELVRNYGGMVL